jgi:hypothetical protein
MSMKKRYAPYRVPIHQILDVRLGEITFQIAMRHGFSISKAITTKPETIVVIAMKTERFAIGLKASTLNT